MSQSVRILGEHAQSDSGGLPVGQARGKIILPGGAGKTRVSLRIVEELTAPGQLSIVLCPSIALVPQLRREYLQHAAVDIRALAVCSDQTAGYDPKKESTRNTDLEPTADNSNVSASEIKGLVTTDAEAIGCGYACPQAIKRQRPKLPSGYGMPPLGLLSSPDYSLSQYCPPVVYRLSLCKNALPARRVDQNPPYAPNRNTRRILLC